MDKYKLSLDKPEVFKNIKVGDKIFWIPTHIGGNQIIYDHQKTYYDVSYFPATILRYRFYLPMIDYFLIEIL